MFKLNCVQNYTYKVLRRCPVGYFPPQFAQASSVEGPRKVEPYWKLHDSIRRPNVVIIGAGLAGLSAAHRLVQCGISTVKVLEATGRPGGRILSRRLGDTVIEMGAERIESACVANAVYTLAWRHGLLKSGKARSAAPRGYFFSREGRVICHDLAEKACRRFDEILRKARKRRDEEGSAVDYLDDLIGDALTDVDEIDRYDTALVLYCLVNRLSEWAGDDAEKLRPAALGGRATVHRGGLRVPGGLSSVLRPLEKALPENSVLYKKPVRCVRYGCAGREGPRAVVVTADGQEHRADYVIVTVSLGVLKHTAHRLFSPGLPKFKMDAVEKVGFGHANKLFLRYEAPFWNGREGDIHLAWSPGDVDKKVAWYHGLAALSPAGGKVLVGTVAGAGARALESTPDADVARDVTRVLRSFTGDPALPPPSEIARSSWSTDPYVFGSCSYLGPDSRDRDVCDLMAPLPLEINDKVPTLLFAGEHTVRARLGTLHAARQSGVREAERLVRLTAALRGPPDSRAADVVDVAPALRHPVCLS